MTAVHVDADRTLLTAVPSPPSETVDVRLNGFERAFNYTLDVLLRDLLIGASITFFASAAVAWILAEVPVASMPVLGALVGVGRLVGRHFRFNPPAVRTARRPVTPRRWSW